MMSAPYEVRLAVFEGPLDLLLHLIEKQEVDIWQVSMAEVADQYLAFLAQVPKVELESAGEYLAMAALLVRMKARHLLPYVEPEDEDDEDEVDFEESIKRQLIEYKRYKEVAQSLAQLAASRARLNLRAISPDLAPSAPMDGPPADFAAAQLAEAFATLLANAPPPPKKPPLLRRVDLHRKVADVRQRVRAATDGIAFSSLFTPSSSRWEWIVTFLAVLELIHKSEIFVRQDELFGELQLRAAGLMA